MNQFLWAENLVSSLVTSSYGRLTDSFSSASCEDNRRWTCNNLSELFLDELSNATDWAAILFTCLAQPSLHGTSASDISPFSVQQSLGSLLNHCWCERDGRRDESPSRGTMRSWTVSSIPSFPGWKQLGWIKFLRNSIIPCLDTSAIYRSFDLTSYHLLFCQRIHPIVIPW